MSQFINKLHERFRAYEVEKCNNGMHHPGKQQQQEEKKFFFKSILPYISHKGGKSNVYLNISFQHSGSNQSDLSVVTDEELVEAAEQGT